MKIYLASRYNRNAEMRQVRDRLVALGQEVTSRWIDLHGGLRPNSATTEELNDSPGYGAEYAIADLEDIERADVVISFTGFGGKGGRHVEFGIALALLKINLVVGPREHVFHSLPSVGHFATLEDLEAGLEKLQFLVDNPGSWETAE